MGDVFLRPVPSDAAAGDVRLYDPTVGDAGGVIAGLASQTIVVGEAGVGKLLLQALASNTIGIGQTTSGKAIIQGTA